MHDCQALLINPSLLPIHLWISLHLSTKIQLSCQKESHRAYTLQDDYQGRPPTAPLKYAMTVHNVA